MHSLLCFSPKVTCVTSIYSPLPRKSRGPKYKWPGNYEGAHGYLVSSKCFWHLIIK